MDIPTNPGTSLASAIGDLDGNNKLDIILSGGKKIIVREFSEKIVDETSFHWPMFQHDPQHTGCYGCDGVIKPPRRGNLTKDCFDSDGGKNYLEKGITSGGNYDICVRAKIREWFCDNNDNPDSETVNCPSGYECKVGACVKKEIEFSEDDCRSCIEGGNKWCGEYVGRRRIYPAECITSQEDEEDCYGRIYTNIKECLKVIPE